jgi:hypothetical protein
MRTEYVTATADGGELSLSWYQNATAEPPGGAVVFLHGGGFGAAVTDLRDARRPNDRPGSAAAT